MSLRNRVLIAEDEVFTALELQFHLEQLGYQVVDLVSSGRQAVERALELKPDLMMMDVRLEGELDGIDAFMEIREKHDVPVIFLTAFGDEETIRRAKDSGAFGYILKPFKERELRAMIEVALNRHERLHDLQKSHDDLQEILDGLRLGTAMTDGAGRITFISRVASRLLGTTEEKAQGRMWYDIFPFGASTLDALRTIAEEPRSKQAEKITTTVTHRNGRSFFMEVEVQADPRNSLRRIFVFYDVTEVHDLRRQLNQDSHYHDLIGESAGMRSVFSQIQAVAVLDTTVLIEGETGTGKELVARAIHRASSRSAKPFVAVNCAALTESLAASQLFGHKKGAFTGAVSDERGFFGAADGGTLFLDEIGDIPLDVQVNLLRVLEERTVTRVGETRPRKVDVRIVSASHRSLPQEVEAGRFRADLLYRIRVARVDLPALRERRGDIPILVQSFLSKFCTRIGKDVSDISSSAMRAMIDYAWPGNVRELRNAVEYAVIRCNSSVIQPPDLPPEVRNATESTPDVAGSTRKERLLAALSHTNGNRKAAAELLGISRATLYRRLAETGIE
ncbi:MAG: sigma 54-interacting transcriptional regulator [Rhodothermales bacterium]|nr:sigma 54-interacting transcriptional regulator [Rhodothermales bacterium]